MATKAEAKALIQKIAEGNGQLDRDAWDEIKKKVPEQYETIQKAMRTLEEKAGASITTLAETIYNSGARFVFELLQNADDNNFTEDCVHPYIHFQIHLEGNPRRIVVECNEDGFSQANLEAICSVGKSSKVGSHGYIGNKGIGFKSVFMAAWKVYIQSGHFSFYFEHHKDARGLGMVSPVWTETEAGGTNARLTRMTLYIHTGQNEEFYETIRTQFENLQPTCLLFLRKLRQIEITFFDKDGQQSKSETFVSEVDRNHVTVLKAINRTRGADVQETSTYYHRFTQEASNLPPRADRTLATAPADPKLSSSAEIVLAFPVDEEGLPLNDEQQIFTFLPMASSSYRFIIHSDFDTTASREDIVTTSSRNKELITHIAIAFVNAIMKFCREVPVLRYKWPLYLPIFEQTHNEFWKALNEKIKLMIRLSPVLESRNRRELRAMDNVVFVGSDFQLYDLDLPLLDDVTLDPFLSPSYPSSALDILRTYGLEVMDFSLAVDLVVLDLKRSHSMIKSPLTSQDWHSAFTQLFMKFVDERDFNRLKYLELIPLWDGGWACGWSPGLLLPSTDGVDLPKGLPLQIIDPAAVASAERAAFFVKLGASKPSIVDIRTVIDSCYSHEEDGSASKPTVNKEVSNGHLRYLYNTWQHPWSAHLTSRDCLGRIYLHTKSNTTIFPLQSDVYFPGTHQYDAEVVLRKSSDAPGFDAEILDPVYLDHPPAAVENDSVRAKVSWKVWLNREFEIRETIRVVDRSSDSLSDVWNYVATHRPKSLLPMLQYLWKHEKSDILSSEHLKSKLMGISARQLCQFSEMPDCELSDTFLPVPALQETYLRYTAKDQKFPFLDLDMSDIVKWEFLSSDLSVNRETGLKFLLDILWWTKRMNPVLLDDERHKKLLQLYVAIRAQCVSDGDGCDERKQVSTFVERNKLVYTASSADGSVSWSPSSACRWNAPPNMVSKIPINIEETFTDLSMFYTQILGIQNISSEDIVFELRQLSEKRDVDWVHIRNLYQKLSHQTGRADTSYLHNEFASNTLIYIADVRPFWFKASECLWLSSTTISGRVAISDHYPNLKGFFVNVLGVKELTMQMVYDDLLHSNDGKSTDDVKNNIRSFSDLLMTEQSGVVEPQPLLNRSIFAVRRTDGSSTLVSQATEFGIPDRADLENHFRGKIAMLDYSLEEIVRLRPFFDWTGLNTRFLSASVKETTSILGSHTRPIATPVREIKTKAYAILRIAATFNSRRWRDNATSLYKTLRNTIVLETDNILSELTLNQNGRNVTVKLEAGDMHIDENKLEESMKVYVPHRRKTQDICFNSALPRSFATWLMGETDRRPSESIQSDLILVLTSCLSNGRSVVDDLLERHGIITISTIDEDLRSSDGDDLEESDKEAEARSESSHETNESDDAGSGSTDRVLPLHSVAVEISSLPSMTEQLNSHGTANRIPELSSTTTTTTETPYSLSHAAQSAFFDPIYTTEPSDQNADSQARTSGVSTSVALRHSASPFASDLSQSNETTQYRNLLNKIVRNARRPLLFPSTGVYDMSAMANALPADEVEQYDGLEEIERFRFTSQFERNAKIGAAGELYVYERLLHLTRRLQDWSLENWQSSIRHYVRCHEDYQALQRWSGRETSDFVYTDTNGEFRRILVEKGYLNHSIPSSATTGTEYFIEVKSTTGGCETPFYMSRNQFEMMQRMHSENDVTQTYMIVRVFNLNSNNINMKIYMDPEQLRADGGLIFTADKYSITPGRQ